MDELAPGIRHWAAEHPNIGMEVSSYWLPDLKILLDPLGMPPEVDDVDHIVLTNRHHKRDAIEARARLGAAIYAPRAGAHEFDAGDPIEFYDFEVPLVDGAVTPHQVSELWPDDCVLHILSVDALAVADTVIHYGEELRFVPDNLMGDAEAEKRDIGQGLRRLAEQLEFSHLLLVHGTPIMGDGRERLREFAG